jgi:hypothetical protein
MLVSSDSSSRPRPRYSRIFGTSLAIVAFAGAFGAGAPEAQGADDKAACVASYDRSQMLRKDHRLQRAREELRSCSRAVCPALVRNDCLTWLDQVQAELPSLAIRATKDGADVANVTIVEDEAVVATKLDGSSLEVDPGEHAFRFETEGASPVVMHLVVRERERDRVVPVNFVGPGAAQASGVAPASAEAPAMSRPVPVGAVVLGGIGIAGIATFAAMGVVGKNQQSSLQNSCSPNCSQRDIDKVKTDYIVADVALGVGAAALVSAGVWFLLRPAKSEQAARVGNAIAITPNRGGATLGLRGTF